MSRAAMQLALDALNKVLENVYNKSCATYLSCAPAIDALRAELAKPEPEPAMWIWTDICGVQGSDYIEPDPKSWVKKFNVEPLYRKEDVL